MTASATAAAAVTPAGRLPLLGHVPRLLRAPFSFLESARDLGDLSVVHLGRTPAYLVNDPALLHQLLVTEVGSFDKGPQYDRLRTLLGEGLSLTGGATHRTRRRLMQPAFHHDRVAGYAEPIRRLAGRLVAGWRDGEVVAVDDAMRRLAVTVVAETLCSGGAAGTGARAVGVIEDDLPVVLRGLTWRALSPVRFLERLPLPGNRRFDAANARLRGVVRELVEERAAGETPDGPDDLLALLLRARDPGTGEPLPAGTIRDDLVNLLGAGAETTGNGMAWIWHVLASHPGVEERVHREVGAGELGYVRRVVAETLRLYPPVWLTSRRAVTEVRLGDHLLPAGATVLFCPYTLHRDPRLYPDPERFDPDRWLPERAAGIPRNAYLPFATGPHRCIGDGLALVEMVTVTATVAARCRLRPTAPTAPRATATLTPDQLRMRVEFRGGRPCR